MTFKENVNNAVSAPKNSIANRKILLGCYSRDMSGATRRLGTEPIPPTDFKILNLDSIRIIPFWNRKKMRSLYLDRRSFWELVEIQITLLYSPLRYRGMIIDSAKIDDFLDSGYEIFLFDGTYYDMEGKLGQLSKHNVYVCSGTYPARGGLPFPYFFNPKKIPDFIEKNGVELQAVYDALEDEESRLIYAHHARAIMEGDSSFFRISKYRQYAHPQVSVTSGDVVFEVGAFVGDTILEFNRTAKGVKYYAFEADPESVKKLRINTANIPSVEIIERGAWNSTGEVSFHTGLGHSSRIVDEPTGMTTIKTTTLDSFAQKREVEKLDMITMDIEGAEIEALQGSVEIIKKFKPKLQLSIYHKTEDLYKIPLMIKEMVPEYKLYVGHHTPNVSDTVLYAKI